jgi:hypothetical protein
MISVPSGGLVPQTNPNQSVMNMFSVLKYTVNNETQGQGDFILVPASGE